MKRLLWIAGLLLITLHSWVLSGCELLSEKSGPEQPPVAAVFVANQGNFSDANGSITVYDPSTGKVVQDVIPDLGSIVQSIALHEDKGYIMANSANRIDVFNVQTLQRVGQIPDVTSPRYMFIGSEGQAYVTNLFKENFTGGTVTVLDTDQDRVVQKVDVGNNPEGITQAAGRIYVANHGFGSGHTLSVLNPQTLVVVDTVALDCDGPRFLLTDAEEEVWVFCTGKNIYDENWNLIGQTPGMVLVLEGATARELKRFELSEQIGTMGPGQDAYYAPEAQRIVAVSAGKILQFDTRTNTRLETLTIQEEGSPGIGAVAYDGVEDRLYVGWVTGFTTAGWVGIYTLDGTRVDRFTAGVAPTYIAFRR